MFLSDHFSLLSQENCRIGSRDDFSAPEREIFRKIFGIKKPSENNSEGFQTEDKLAGTAMIPLFRKRKGKKQNTALFRNKTSSGGQMPAIIAFRRVFPSTVGHYADEEKSVESACVSLSLSRVQTLSAL